MIEPQFMNNKKKNNTAAKSSSTVKFLCSYGGKILPRPLDGRLRYVGGHTRILSVDRSVSYSDLISKLEELCGCPSGGVTLRCQLPSEDLDVLVTVKSDEDLANLVEEYRRASSAAGKELKVRAILSTPKRTSSASSSSTPTISPSSSAVDLTRSGSSESDLIRSAGVRRCGSSAPNLTSRVVVAPVTDVWYGSGAGWKGYGGGGGAAWCRRPYGNVQGGSYYRPCYVVTAPAAARYGTRL